MSQRTSSALFMKDLVSHGRKNDPDFTDGLYLDSGEKIGELPLDRLLPLMRMCAKYQGKPANCARCMKIGTGCVKGARLLELSVQSKGQILDGIRIDSAEELQQMIYKERGGNVRREEVCQRAGVSIATLNGWIYGWRRNAPRADTAIRLLQAMGYEIILRKKEGQS